MSFDTYREFEASLQAARERRKKPNVNKRVLKKFILSTEAHNRNQEEQEMWTKHFASKNKNSETSQSSSDERREKKKKRATEKERIDEKKEQKKRYDDESLSSGDEIGPDIDEYMRRSTVKWSHDGYQELYGHSAGSHSEKEKKSIRRSRKTSHRSHEDHKTSEVNDKFNVDCEKRKLANGKKRYREMSSDGSDVVCTSRKKSKRKKSKKKLEWVEKT